MIIKEIPKYELSYWERLWNGIVSGEFTQFKLGALCTNYHHTERVLVKSAEDAALLPERALRRVPCCPNSAFIGNDGEDLNSFCPSHTCTACWDRKWKGEEFQ